MMLEAVEHSCTAIPLKINSIRYMGLNFQVLSSLLNLMQNFGPLYKLRCTVCHCQIILKLELEFCKVAKALKCHIMPVAFFFFDKQMIYI